MLKKKNKKVKEEEVEVNYDPADLYEEEEDLEEDGQLAVDVFQDKKNVIIKSTIAGVEPEDIDITFDNDMITIRCKRKKDLSIEQGDYFYQECYWGGFSRSIILPVDVQEAKIKATIRNGILTIELPKAKKRDINIKVEDDN